MIDEVIAHLIHGTRDANARGDHAQALTLGRSAVRVAPQVAEAWFHLAVALRAVRESDEASKALANAQRLAPRSPAALNSIGLEHLELGNLALAECCLQQALSIDPNYAYALSNLARVHRRLRRLEPAEALLRLAIELRPDLAALFTNLGAVLSEQGRPDEAEQVLRHAVALDPGCVEAWSNLGDTLFDLRRNAQALQAFERLVALSPDYPFARGRLLHARMRVCEWGGIDDLFDSILADMALGKCSAEPFGLQAISHSPAQMLNCARIFVQASHPDRLPPKVRPAPRREPKIRLGYVSGEFRDHATSVLMTEVFERHDRSRFEVFAFDNGWDDGSALRQRMNAAFTEIVDISRLGDEAAVAAIESRGIDILVDLNGFFGLARTGVFCRRPAPIQVNYLGFPGTIGANCHDYIVADDVVIPPGDESFYAERVARLPGCYQANDSRRAIAERVFTRSEAGLPERGFVYCCFNNNYKITAPTFGSWMKILATVPASVLWLLEDTPEAATNLRRHARRHGIDPARLVFASRMPLPEHLARHRLADLFLDTLPSNAHTTASDALWAGLPVLTQTGRTFSGRVATSLLTTLGLPDMITCDASAYEDTAVSMAMQPARLAAAQARLEQARATSTLFDCASLTRALEALFEQMMQRHLAG